MASGGYVDKVNGSTKRMPILLNQFCIRGFVIIAFLISHIILNITLLDISHRNQTKYSNVFYYYKELTKIDTQMII